MKRRVRNECVIIVQPATARAARIGRDSRANLSFGPPTRMYDMSTSGISGRTSQLNHIPRSSVKGLGAQSDPVNWIEDAERWRTGVGVRSTCELEYLSHDLVKFRKERR